MNAEAASPKRPVLRYHGGKWRLAPWIIAHFPAHRVYVEPYGGAASVLMRKPRSYAEVYNDLDSELVSLFRVLRDEDQSRRLREMIEATPFARDDFNESYEASSDPVEQARRTVARSFMGFGSNAHNRRTGFRSNCTRSGTTPAHDWARYPYQLDAVFERLRGVVIENADAYEVLVRYDTPETLHYVDPPYVAKTRNAGKDYEYEMTDEQHAVLAGCLHAQRGMVVLSGYDSDLYAKFYADWTRVEKATMADGARKRTEVLWLNPACSAALELQRSA